MGDSDERIMVHFLYHSKCHLYRHVVIDRPIGDTYLSLTEDVKEIKNLLYQGVKQKVIAEKFGVVRATITHINRGEI